MTKQNIVRLFVMLCLFSGCKNKGEKIGDHYKKFKNNEQKSKELGGAKQFDLDYSLTTKILLKDIDPKIELEASKIIDTGWYVPLETKPENLIGRIGKMMVDKDHLFVQDKNMESLLIFNKSGKYLKKISSKGKGPEEYIALRDFDIDFEKKQILIYDDFGSEIVYYDYKGNFIQKKNTDFLFTNFTSFNNLNYYYLSNTDNILLPEIMNNYLVAVEDGAIKMKVIKNKGYDLPILTHTFQKYEDHLSILVPIESNYIYEIKHKRLIPRYNIDFGALNITDEVLKDPAFKENPFNPKKHFKVAYLKGEFLDTQDFLYFSFISSGEHMQAIYNKKQKKALTWQILDSNDKYSPGYIMPLASIYDENILISPIEPYVFLSDYIKNNPIFKSKSQQFKNLVKETDEMDNPILFFAKLKSPGHSH